MWEAIKLYTSSTWSFLVPFLRIFLSKVGPVLASAAIAAVKAQAAKGATGSEARDAAFDAIKDNLMKQGVTIGSSVIYSAIEAAVQKMKAELTS